MIRINIRSWPDADSVSWDVAPCSPPEIITSNDELVWFFFQLRHNLLLLNQVCVSVCVLFCMSGISSFPSPIQPSIGPFPLRRDWWIINFAISCYVSAPKGKKTMQWMPVSSPQLGTLLYFVALTVDKWPSLVTVHNWLAWIKLSWTAKNP